MSDIPTNELIEFISLNQIVNSTILDELAPQLNGLKSAIELTDELVKRGHLTGYQKTQLLTGKGNKLIFGPYRLIEPLGEGGMGMVFQGWHSRLDRHVALKFIHPSFLGARPNVTKRFQREARAIAQLQHPNIVMLYDADEIDGTPFIAMEFVKGDSLAEMVHRDGRLGIREACDYMRQAALGLQHASDCGLVHRDIKPANILVSHKKIGGSERHLARPKQHSLVTIRDREHAKGSNVADSSSLGPGTIKILDMGLARLRQSLSEEASTDASLTVLTEMGGVLGTPDFISPEQARNPSCVDIRADLYSLGCTFYYILSGRVPFPTGNAIEKMLKHQLDKPHDLCELRSGIPSSVADIVKRLMAKKIEDRYQTPQELADVLTTCLASAPSQIAAPTIGTSISLPPIATRTPAERHKNLVSAPAPLNRFDISPTVGVASGSSTTLSAKIGNPHLKKRIQPDAQMKAHSSVVSAVAMTSDGHFAATGDVDGKIRIWDLTMPEPSEVDSFNRPSEIQVIAFAPDDSDLLVFGELQQSYAALKRWDWRHNRLVSWSDFGELDQFGVGCMSFAADGKMFAAGVGSQVVTGKLNGRDISHWKMYKTQGPPIRSIAISPDRHVLVTSSHGNSIHSWDLTKHRWRRNDGGETKTDISGITSIAFSPDGRWLAMAGLDAKVILSDFNGDSDSVIELQGHTSSLLHLQFTPDGTSLVSISANGEVFFWDGDTAHMSREIRIDLNLAYRIALSADGAQLIAGYTNGNIAFWNLASSCEKSEELSQNLSRIPFRSNRLEIQKL